MSKCVWGVSGAGGGRGIGGGGGLRGEGTNAQRWLEVDLRGMDQAASSLLGALR